MTFEEKINKPRFIKIALNDEMFAELQDVVGYCNRLNGNRVTLESFAAECVETILAERRLGRVPVRTDEYRNRGRKALFKADADLRV